jgi:hypothetical protein
MFRTASIARRCNCGAAIAKEGSSIVLRLFLLLGSFRMNLFWTLPRVRSTATVPVWAGGGAACQGIG